MIDNRNDFQHFVCIVAGNNPEELLKKYDKNIKENKPYVVYRFEDAEIIKQYHIQLYEGLLEKVEGNTKELLKETIEDLKDMSAGEFYEQLTAEYDLDEETGDAISIENKDGKYTYCNIGKALSIPFLTRDGKEVFQAKKSEIEWLKTHLNGGDVYSRVWEMVMENSEPKNDDEKNLFENMKDKVNYFKKFETKENYIISNTAFWGYAFLSEKTGWMDASDCESQFVWMGNYYDLFIKNLPDDTLLTIYECKK